MIFLSFRHKYMRITTHSKYGYRDMISGMWTCTPHEAISHLAILIWSFLTYSPPTRNRACNLTKDTMQEYNIN